VETPSVRRDDAEVVDPFVATQWSESPDIQGLEVRGAHGASCSITMSICAACQERCGGCTTAGPLGPPAIVRRWPGSTSRGSEAWDVGVPGVTHHIEDGVRRRTTHGDPHRMELRFGPPLGVVSRDQISDGFGGGPQLQSLPIWPHNLRSVGETFARGTDPVLEARPARAREITPASADASFDDGDRSRHVRGSNEFRAKGPSGGGPAGMHAMGEVGPGDAGSLAS